MFDLSDTTSVTSFGSPNLGGSRQSLTGHSSAPELLISLCYTSLTGRLTVEVLKASNLRYLQIQRAPGEFYLMYFHIAKINILYIYTVFRFPKLIILILVVLLPKIKISISITSFNGYKSKQRKLYRRKVLDHKALLGR